MAVMDSEKKIESIKVLGGGCNKCETLLKNTKEAMNDMGNDTEVQYITDAKQLAEYGGMRMPLLVVNEEVVSMGKVLKPEEVVDTLHKSGF